MARGVPGGDRARPVRTGRRMRDRRRGRRVPAGRRLRQLLPALWDCRGQHAGSRGRARIRRDRGSERDAACRPVLGPAWRRRRHVRRGHQADDADPPHAAHAQHGAGHDPRQRRLGVPAPAHRARPVPAEPVQRPLGRADHALRRQLGRVRDARRGPGRRAGPGGLAAISRLDRRTARSIRVDGVGQNDHVRRALGCRAAGPVLAGLHQPRRPPWRAARAVLERDEPDGGVVVCACVRLAMAATATARRRGRAGRRAVRGLPALAVPAPRQQGPVRGGARGRSQGPRHGDQPGGIRRGGPGADRLVAAVRVSRSSRATSQTRRTPLLARAWSARPWTSCARSPLGPGAM